MWWRIQGAPLIRGSLRPLLLLWLHYGACYHRRVGATPQSSPAARWVSSR